MLQYEMFLFHLRNKGRNVRDVSGMEAPQHFLRHWSQTGASWKALLNFYQRISPHDLADEKADKEHLWSFPNLPRVLISHSLQNPVHGESVRLACKAGTICSELFNTLLPVCFILSAHQLWFSYTQNQSFCRPAGWLQWFLLWLFFC